MTPAEVSTPTRSMTTDCTISKIQSPYQPPPKDLLEVPVDNTDTTCEKIEQSPSKGSEDGLPAVCQQKAAFLPPPVYMIVLNGTFPHVSPIFSLPDQRIVAFNSLNSGSENFRR